MAHYFHVFCFWPKISVYFVFIGIFLLSPTPPSHVSTTSSIIGINSSINARSAAFAWGQQIEEIESIGVVVNKTEEEMIQDIVNHMETFTFRLWSPRNQHTTVSLSLPIFSPTLDVVNSASQLCKPVVDHDPLTGKPYSSNDWSRCMLPAIQSIRWKRVEAFTELVARKYDVMLHSSVVYMLYHAYEKSPSFSSSSVDKKTKTACILGNPSGATLFPVLSSSSQLSRIIVFALNSGLVEDSLKPVDSSSLPTAVNLPYWPYRVANEFAKHWNVTLEYYHATSLLGELKRSEEVKGREVEICSVTSKEREGIDGGDDAEDRLKCEKWLHETVFPHKEQCDIIQIHPEFYMIESNPLCGLHSQNIEGQTLEKKERLRFCESLHTNKTKEILGNIVDFLHKDSVYLQEREKQPVKQKANHTLQRTRLIWISLHHAFQKPLVSMYDWQVKNTWFYLSAIGTTPDRNGFYQKTYSQSNPEQLVTVYIGRRKVNSTIVDNEGSLSPNTQGKNTKGQPIIVITTANRILLDNVFGLQEKLKLLGYKFVQFTNDFSLQTNELLNELINNKNNNKQINNNNDYYYLLQISVAPTDVEIFSKHYIIFNCEQQWSDYAFGVGLNRFHFVMYESRAVWTYFQRNVDFIRSLSSNVSLEAIATSTTIEDIDRRKEVTLEEKTFLVPFYYIHDRMYEHNSGLVHSLTKRMSPNVFGLESIFRMMMNTTVPTIGDRSSDHDSDSIEKMGDYFLFFFGSNSARRHHALAYLDQRIRDEQSKDPTYFSRNSSDVIQSVNGEMIHGQKGLDNGYVRFLYVAGNWKILLFDLERDFYVHNSIAVLNINNENTSSLEEHRLNYFLSMGKIIFSERGAYPEMCEKYGNAITFVDSIEEMFDEVVKFFHATPSLDEEIKRRQALAIEKHRELSQNLTLLRHAMDFVLTTIDL